MAPGQGISPPTPRELNPARLPVLWHLKVSNYNEKARWALDFKRVPHLRRAVVPGRHRAIAQAMTGGRTLPVLELDGSFIGDSTAIIGWLEREFPEPPLYPRDWGEQRRALELEEFFDEELGPYARLLFLHHTLPDPRLMLGAFAPDLRGVPLYLARLTYPAIRRGVRRDFEVDSRGVDLAYEKLDAAGARFRSQLQPSGYLVGRRFCVADLALAALIAPLVAPPEFPYPQPQRGHPRLVPLRRALASHGLVDWTLEMYARHRGRSAEVQPKRRGLPSAGAAAAVPGSVWPDRASAGDTPARARSG
jgi:glutathione S-transferase